MLFDQGLIVALLVSLVFSRTAPEFLATVSIIGLIPVVISAARALYRREITIDLLASIALFFTLVDRQWISAGFINLMLASARLFDAYTERRTENAIGSLLKFRPVVVKLIQADKTITTAPLETVRVGNLVAIAAGERVPVDGIVTSGQATLDQSTLTGESRPVSKKPGDKVLSSTLCLEGSLVVQAEKVGEDTTLAKIIALVDESSRLKTKMETLANRFSSYYIGATLLGSGLIYLSTQNLSLVLSLLLVTCADDLAVAIPLGWTIAINKAARHGIVVKGAAVMERLRGIKTIVTDKTGTLTTGAFRIVDFVTVGEISSQEFKQIIGSCLADSIHPVSKAIRANLETEKIKTLLPTAWRELPGEGVTATIDHQTYFAGKESFLQAQGIKIKPELETQINKVAQGASLVLLGRGETLLGYVILEDELRPHAAEVIAATTNEGVKHWVMLTGDNRQVAARIAKRLGIKDFAAELMPADKLDKIKSLKRAHGEVAMIGDGVNDAAALALADVSFAMGAIGADASIQAADIALMKDDLRGVPEAIFLSDRSLKIIRQNFWIWALSNLLGLTLVFGGWLGPIGASAYNFLTDFIPIINVFTIYRLKFSWHE